ncbi:LCP family protein [Eubacterium limosum]|uniref:LCP family protein n=1 Tax=Eubacterium limosum TaxID=1736 RepID=A0ABT5UX72_EUBLI|nr:LCP family protein [Eubacterium limosum]MCB6571831.1 LCP family protein [Eubacterium limosum]MDE1472580.1 LCP family protein [Eubacterium limosum]
MGKNKIGGMSTGKKVALIIVAIIFALILGGGLYAYSYIQNTMNKMDKVDISDNAQDLGITENKNGEIVNIALYGIDAAEGETGRSDSIMILTLDNVHNRIKLTSVMRDSYVDIAGHGMDKINHAYAFGGPELAIRTLNENFGLNITDFMSVNFTSMPEIIDMLGGVSIDITDEEIATGQIPGLYQSGTQLLTGEQALAYSRIRYASGNDFKRTERQRTVLNALVVKMIQQPVTSYPGLISDLAPYITTSLSNQEMLDMTTKYGSLAKQGIRQNRFPQDDDANGQMIDGVYYLVFDIPTVREKMDAYIFEDQSV